AVPVLSLVPKVCNGTVVVWIHPQGRASLFNDGKLVPAAQKILDQKEAIMAVDVFGVGELTPPKPLPVSRQYAGYTFGYNRPLLANRVHDILTAVAAAKKNPEVRTVHLVGWEKAGPWVLLARGLCGNAVARTAADYAAFSFTKVKTS